MRQAAMATNEAWRQQLVEPRWYVVRSNSHQEKLARLSLEDAEFDAYLPMVPRKLKSGDISSAPMFGGYLFARLVLGGEGSTRLFTSRGVHSVIGNGQRPTPIADLAIHKIRVVEREAFAEMGMAAQTVEIPDFDRGQSVKIMTGPLAGLDAEFVKKVDALRCQVLLKIVGDSPRLARIALASLK